MDFPTAADLEHRDYDRLHRRITQADPAGLLGAGRAVRSFLGRNTNPVYADAIVRTLDSAAWEALGDLDWDIDPLWAGLYTKNLTIVMKNVHREFRGIMDDNAPHEE
jgi:hypothetical protein